MAGGPGQPAESADGESRTAAPRAPAGPPVVAPGPAALAERRHRKEHRRREQHRHRLRPAVVGADPDRRRFRAAPAVTSRTAITVPGRTVVTARAASPQQAHPDGAQGACEQDPGHKHHHHLGGLPPSRNSRTAGGHRLGWPLPVRGRWGRLSARTSVQGAPVHDPCSRCGDEMEPSGARHSTAITHSVHSCITGDPLESVYTPLTRWCGTGIERTRTLGGGARGGSPGGGPDGGRLPGCSGGTFGRPPPSGVSALRRFRAQGAGTGRPMAGPLGRAQIRLRQRDRHLGALPRRAGELDPALVCPD